jgi:DNA-binding NarL/FixJ family response regulator
MESTGLAVRRNSAPLTELRQLRREPAWEYYSYVSVASPHGLVAERRTSDAYAMRGSLPDATSPRAPAPLRRSEEGVESTGMTTPASRKSEGKTWGPWSLTQRELEVLQLLTEGATNGDIAERLFISQKTTKNHLASIFQKLDVTNRTQALVRAVIMGLVSIE